MFGKKIAIPTFMLGYITEVDLELAERSFPGINQLYNRLESKPRTFLELVWMYISLSTSNRLLESGTTAETVPA